MGQKKHKQNSKCVWELWAERDGSQLMTGPVRAFLYYYLGRCERLGKPLKIKLGDEWDDESCAAFRATYSGMYKGLLKLQEFCPGIHWTVVLRGGEPTDKWRFFHPGATAA